MFQPGGRGTHGIDPVTDTAENRFLLLMDNVIGGYRVFRIILQKLFGLFGKRYRRPFRFGRNRQRRNDTGDGGVDAGFEHEKPHKQSDDKVGENHVNPEAVKRNHHQKHDSGQSQGQIIDLIGIKRGNHQNSSQIIDNGQGDEERH